MIMPYLSSIVLTIAFAAGICATVAPAPNINAAATCFDWSIVANTANVAATCFENDGITQSNTVIELSQCTGNQNGAVGCQLNGGAGASCVFSNIQTGVPSTSVSNELTITASCLNVEQVRVTTANFNLDACLTNSNGQLTC